jgi:hypothetical protein
MASAAEAEIGALYIDSQTAEVFRTTLIEMGHPQPPTPVQTDNSTAYGIVNSSIRKRRKTCGSIGYATASTKNIFLFIGNPAQKTLVTISPSTAPQPITKPCAPRTYKSPKQLFPLQFTSQIVCEGVLILAYHTLLRLITQLITHCATSSVSLICSNTD